MVICEHKDKRRLYERGKSFKSIPLYKCQDCGRLLRIVLKEEEVEKYE